MGECVLGEQELLDRVNQDEFALLDRELEEQFGDAYETSPASWLLVSEAFPEIQQSTREEGTRFLGSVAIRGLRGEINATETGNTTTLLAATQLASLGDKQAIAAIRTNVATDVAERLFKAAHQTSIQMQMVGGRLQQQGRHLTDLHRNALEQTVLNDEMLRRTKHELHNALLFEKLHREGVLTHYDAVVFSPASTTMTRDQKKSYGFFIDTETCSIQRLSAEGDDVTLESAFVAGKRSPDSARHDLATIRDLAANRGLELNADDGTDTIRQVFLIPKEDIHGVEDVVAWYDEAAGGTFYGQEKPRQNYTAYARECQERTAGFSDIVEIITQQLTREAAGFRTPMEAVLRLDELSERLCVKRAIHDTTLDEAVFGQTAATHIQEARFFMSQGEYERAEQSMEMAQKTAESSSCPLFKEQSGDGDSSNSNNATSEGEAGSDKKWINCPYCKAKVLADPCANKISCWDCTAMVVGGKIISKGNGGSNKRRATHTAEPTPSTVPKDTAELEASTPVAVHQKPKAEGNHDDDTDYEEVTNIGSLAMAGVS